MATTAGIVELAMTLPEQTSLAKWLTETGALGLTIGFGSAAVFRGWLPPWLRGRVVSVRLWGVGFLLLGLGTSVELVSERQVSGAAFAVWTAGCVVMLWSQRPGRRRARRR